jgi:hypothetical protein
MEPTSLPIVICEVAPIYPPLVSKERSLRIRTIESASSLSLDLESISPKDEFFLLESAALLVSWLEPGVTPLSGTDRESLKLYNVKDVTWSKRSFFFRKSSSSTTLLSREAMYWFLPNGIGFEGIT